MPQKKAAQAIPNYRLKQARLDRRWTQSDIADKMGVDTSYVSRWESGVLIPSSSNQEKLCSLFGKAPKEMGFVSEINFAPSAPVYDPTIPFHFRNPQDFIGRGEILAQLKQYLYSSESIILTALHGLPGVGKTALAVELAHALDVQEHFRDGILWAGLGPHPNISEILSRWGRLLGLRGAEMKALRDSDAWALAICNAIGMRRMLLVIDDAWKVEDALAFELGGPSCAYLVTTRISDVAIHFRGGQTILVQELSEDDGVRLLARLAPVVIQTEPEDARVLVREVGGLPLALLLMGSYLLTQTYHNQPNRIRVALKKLHSAEERLKLAQPQGGLQRHTSLPKGASISLLTVIGVSYEEALDDISRKALRAFSIFPPKPNTFSEEAALTVAATTAEILYRLVDSNLVEVNGQSRYTLHQTIADYAGIKRTDIAANERMVEYFVSYVAAHETDYGTLEPEAGNVLTALQTAFEQGMQADLVRGVNAFFHFLSTRGLYTQAETHLKRAEEAARSINEPVSLATVLLNLGKIAKLRGNYTNAKEYDTESLALARQSEHSSNITSALQDLGDLARLQGKPEEAHRFLKEALDLAQEANDAKAIARTQHDLGILMAAMGKLGEAGQLWEAGLKIFYQLGDQRNVAIILGHLGVLAREQGQIEKAHQFIEKAKIIFHQLGDLSNIAEQVREQGHLARDQGQPEEAHQFFEEALTIFRQLGNQLGIAKLLLDLANLAQDQKQLTLAHQLLEEALSLFQQLGNQGAIAHTMSSLGFLAQNQEQPDKAKQLFEEALTIFRQLGSTKYVADLMYFLGLLAESYGRSNEALQQLLRASVGFELTNPFDTQTALEALGRLCAKLDKATFIEEVNHIANSVPEPSYNLDQTTWATAVRAIAARISLR